MNPTFIITFASSQEDSIPNIIVLIRFLIFKRCKSNDKSRIHNELFYIFVRKIKTTAYQNAEEDCTLGYRYYIRYIYRNYHFAEYSFYSAKYDHVCRKRTIPDIRY